MSAFGTIWSVVVSLFLGYCGWLLIFRTSTIFSRARRTYGYNFFLKPWYSMFMRCIGIFILILTALTDCLLVRLISH